MPKYEIVDCEILNFALGQTADSIRSKGGTNEPITWDEESGFAAAIDAIVVFSGVSGEVGEKVDGKVVKFYDYDGTLLHEFTAEEAMILTELPPYPVHPGLICTGWNWNITEIKNAVENQDMSVDVGAMYKTDDDKTRIYITLEEGRTSPMLGLCVKGGVYVDWGDGTDPELLTGTSASSSPRWTSTHKYASPGDYIITLTLRDSSTTFGFYGSSSNNQYCGLLRSSSSADVRNYAYHNAIRKIECGKGVVGINDNAFNGCHSLTSITLNSETTAIKTSAFQGCHSLSSIVVPDEVTEIYDEAFSECYSLLRVVLPPSTTEFGTAAFESCHSLDSIILPYSTVEITNDIFVNCYSLSSVTIPHTVTSIGNAAFRFCYSLSKITLPPSATYIGSQAFYDCSSITDIVIPDGITNIEENTFERCSSLHKIVIPDSVITIEQGAFRDCSSITDIVIPDSVTSIGDEAFYGCYSLASVVIPDGVASIGDSAFDLCKSLDNIIIPDGVTEIGSYTFEECNSLSRVVIPNSVTKIGDYAFYYCTTLGRTILPDGVTDIPSRAYYGCTSLTSVIVQGDVTNIRAYAFYNCYGVAFYDFTNCTSVPTLASSNAFTGIPTDCEIRVPASLVDEWKTATNWSSYASRIVGV